MPKCVWFEGVEVRTMDDGLERRAPQPAGETFRWHQDCRHFVGGLPCKYWRACPGCPHHSPVTSRYLIVMLGFLGDTLIASPLPARIKRDDPGAHITWLIDDASAPLAAMNPFVDRVLVYDWEVSLQLLGETFDVLLNFERRASTASLCEQITARHRAGLGYGGGDNTLYALTPPSEHFFLMNTWNDFRTTMNTKTWTELYFEVAGFTYDEEPYVLEIPEEADVAVRGLLHATAGRRLVSLNLGGSFMLKVWPDRHWFALADALLDRGVAVVLSGGPKEAERCTRLHRELSRRHPGEGLVIDGNLPIEQSAAVPRHCDVVVTGDSFGFHLALAHERPCVVLFGPSRPDEVVPKHVADVVVLTSTLPCSPCAHQVTCGHVGGCMDAVEPSLVLGHVERLLEAGSLGNSPPGVDPLDDLHQAALDVAGPEGPDAG